MVIEIHINGRLWYRDTWQDEIPSALSIEERTSHREAHCRQLVEQLREIILAHFNPTNYEIYFIYESTMTDDEQQSEN